MGIALAALASASLADPLASNPLATAMGWLQGTLLGTLATAVAVIAVAALGMMMLTGRLNLKRGATTILGCFILFGAPSIATGVLAMREQTSSPTQMSGASHTLPPPFPTPIPTPAFDPYAGASLQPR